MYLPDPRRNGPRIVIDGWCGVVSRDQLRDATLLELSETGIRLERVFDPRVAARTVALEIELPGVDEIIWARADVAFARLTPLGGTHASGQPRLLCRAGLRIADAASRHLRLLRDFVFATHVHAIALACVLVALLAPAVARADDDPAMQLMSVMMRCPAISSDGKHVAIYSNDPGADKGAKTSLAVFDPTGKLEQRISIVPPATDVAKAKAAAAKVIKLLDDGGYERMSRVARKTEKSSKTTYTTQLSSEDVVLDVALAAGKLRLTGTRAGKPLAAIDRALGKDGPCASVDSYSLANTQPGFDAKSGLFAFSIQAFHGDDGCFAYDFVVPLR